MEVCANCLCYRLYNITLYYWLECNNCHNPLCADCSKKLKVNDIIVCERCSYKKENEKFKNKEQDLFEEILELKKEIDILNQKLIELESRPPNLGGKIYLEAKEHYKKIQEN